MYQEEYKRWLEADLEDADLSPELARIEGNDEEIKLCGGKLFRRKSLPPPPFQKALYKMFF